MEGQRNCCDEKDEKWRPPSWEPLRLRNLIAGHSTGGPNRPPLTLKRSENKWSMCCHLPHTKACCENRNLADIAECRSHDNCHGHGKCAQQRARRTSDKLDDALLGDLPSVPLRVSAACSERPAKAGLGTPLHKGTSGPCSPDRHRPLVKACSRRHTWVTESPLHMTKLMFTARLRLAEPARMTIPRKNHMQATKLRGDRGVRK